MIFGSEEFGTRRVGAVRWLANGSSFTILEDSKNGDFESSDESNQKKRKDHL